MQDGGTLGDVGRHPAEQRQLIVLHLKFKPIGRDARKIRPKHQSIV